MPALPPAPGMYAYMDLAPALTLLRGYHASCHRDLLDFAKKRSHHRAQASVALLPWLVPYGDTHKPTLRSLLLQAAQPGVCLVVQPRRAARLDGAHAGLPETTDQRAAGHPTQRRPAGAGRGPAQRGSGLACHCYEAAEESLLALATLADPNRPLCQAL